MSKISNPTYSVRCHCGILEANFKITSDEIVAWKCTCSDCWMRGNVHFIIPESDFALDINTDHSFEDVTILYEWGTMTAKRRFCKKCGILPWYNPRSNPDGVAITLNCVDWDSSIEKPKVRIEHFDGRNWENSFQSSKIEEESKK